MPMLTDKVVTVLIFVFRDGIAAVLGHDLKLQAKSLTCMFSPMPDGTFSLSAVVDARQIDVVCARSDGHDLPAALSSSDRHEIRRHLLYDVLDTESHQEIRFASTRVVKSGNDFHITGNLVMTGHTHQLHFTVMKADANYIAKIHINQRDFGIKPYSEAFGLLKIKSDVLVEVSLPVNALVPDESEPPAPPMP